MDTNPDIIAVVSAIIAAAITVVGNWGKLAASLKVLWAKARGEEAVAESKRLENDRYAADTAFAQIDRLDKRLELIEGKNDELRRCVEETRATMDAQKKYYEAQMERLVAQRDAALAQAKRFREMALVLQAQLEAECLTPAIDVTQEQLIDFS